MTNQKRCIYIYIYLYVILHSNGRIRILKQLKGKDGRYSVIHLRTGMCDQDSAIKMVQLTRAD